MTESTPLKRSPEEFAKLLEEIGAESNPPVEKWHPEVEVEIDMSINRKGEWIHNGKPIERAAIIKLFSSILVRDDDGHHYLVTPVEKARLEVADAPFLVTEMSQYLDGNGQSVIVFTTNTGERVVLNSKHGLRVLHDEETGETIPYLQLDRRLEARVGRNVFYELVGMAEHSELGDKTQLTLHSQGEDFILGFY